MISRLASALLIGLAAAAPAAAESYKWVDAKGVVNYSNTPPPDSAKTSKVVEERISVMGLDPGVARWAAAQQARRTEVDQRDWDQRQRAFLMQASSASTYDSQSYDNSYYAYPAYYGGYGYRARPIHRHPHVAPRAPRGRPAR